MVMGAIILSAWAIVLIPVVTLWLIGRGIMAVWGFTFGKDSGKLKQ